MDKDFHKRLMEILNTEKQTWWAEKTETSQSMVSNYWFRGKDVRGGKLLKILKLKNISANWLFFGVGPKSLEDLDAAAIDEKQNADRKTQIEIMELTHENLLIKDRLKRCEIRAKEAILAAGLRDFVADRGEGSIGNTFIKSLSLLKMMIDIIMKMAESYSKANLDEAEYLKIIEWVVSNLESQQYSTASTLKSLENLIK